jgi:hypothetical protein
VRQEITTLDPEFVAWLTRSDAAPVPGWAPEPSASNAQCAPRLVARLTEITKPVANVTRTFVAGSPVVHRRNGRAIAAASGTSWLAVRSGAPAGDLAPRSHVFELPPDWVELDPWPQDIAFARGVDLLRRHVKRAYERAGTAA